MITNKTLFILGAGASLPYGLPLGSTLRQSLCHLDQDYQTSELLIRSGLATERDIRWLSAAFRNSKQASIDTFLSLRPDYAELGKLAIAASLCAKEVPDALTSGSIHDDWFLTLWKEMQDGAAEAEDIGKNAVRFVTFNYDRSLEALLHEAIRNSFEGISHEHAYDVLSKIPIIHPYGSLGKFHWVTLSDGFRPYKNSFSNDDPLTAFEIKSAAHSIKVIPESRKDDEVFDQVADSVFWAEQVIIMGFSFDPLNMERLGLDRCFASLRSSNRPVPQLIASTYKLTGSEVERIKTRFFPNSGARDFHSLENQMLLRESTLLSWQ